MAHTHEFIARIDWTGADKGTTTDYKTYSRDYDISIKGRQKIKGSADPIFLGTDDRYNPEDLLVASLSACHMLSYLALCARNKIEVLDYHDDAWGKMEMKEGSLRFTDVLLKPVVTIASDGNLEKAKRLHHDAHGVCFIANSVNFPVRNEATVSLAK